MEFNFKLTFFVYGCCWVFFATAPCTGAETEDASPNLSCNVHLVQVRKISDKKLLCGYFTVSSHLSFGSTYQLQQMQVNLTYTAGRSPVSFNTTMSNEICHENGDLFIGHNKLKIKIVLCGLLAVDSHVRDKLAVVNISSEVPLVLSNKANVIKECGLFSNVATNTKIMKRKMVIIDPCTNSGCPNNLCKQTCASLLEDNGSLYRCQDGDIRAADRFIRLPILSAAHLPKINYVCAAVGYQTTGDIKNIVMMEPLHTVTFMLNMTHSGDETKSYDEEINVTNETRLCINFGKITVVHGSRTFLCGPLSRPVPNDYSISFSGIKGNPSIKYRTILQDGTTLNGVALIRADNGPIQTEVIDWLHIDACFGKCDRDCIPTCRTLLDGDMFDDQCYRGNNADILDTTVVDNIETTVKDDIATSTIPLTDTQSTMHSSQQALKVVSDESTTNVTTAVGKAQIDIFHTHVSNDTTPTMPSCEITMSSIRLIVNKNMLCVTLSYPGNIKRHDTFELLNKSLSINYSLDRLSGETHTVELSGTECAEDKAGVTSDIHWCGLLPESQHTEHTLLFSGLVTEGDFLISDQNVDNINCSLLSTVKANETISIKNLAIPDACHEGYCRTCKQTCMSLMMGDGGLYTCDDDVQRVSNSVVQLKVTRSIIVPEKRAICLIIEPKIVGDVSNVTLLTSDSFNFTLSSRLTGNCVPTEQVAVNTDEGVPCVSITNVKLHDRRHTLCGWFKENIDSGTHKRFEDIKGNSIINYKANSLSGRGIWGSTRLTIPWQVLTYKPTVIKRTFDDTCKEQCGIECAPSCNMWLWNFRGDCHPMNASSTPFTKAGGKPSLPKTKDTITTVEPNNYKQISSGAMGLIIGKIIMTLCILFAVK